MNQLTKFRSVLKEDQSLMTVALGLVLFSLSVLGAGEIAYHIGHYLGNC